MRVNSPVRYFYQTFEISGNPHIYQAYDLDGNMRGELLIEK